MGITVASQQEGSWFEPWIPEPGVLCGVCMFSLCQRGFLPGALLSSTQSKDMQVSWIGHAKLAIGVCVCVSQHSQSGKASSVKPVPNPLCLCG